MPSSRLGVVITLRDWTPAIQDAPIVPERNGSATFLKLAGRLSRIVDRRTFAVRLEATATEGAALDVGRGSEKAVHSSSPAFISERLPDPADEVDVERRAERRRSWEARRR